jgi:multiple sugar transport system substrate-binding protein
MKGNTFKIAVRKFAPFESAVQKIWDSFCLETGCNLNLEMVAMDLHPLHESTLEKEGLKNGEWDIAHINTDWLFEAYSTGAIENLTPYIKKNSPEDYPHGWSKSLLSMQQVEGFTAGLPFHDGPECLIYRKDLFGDEEEKGKYYRQYGKKLNPPETWDEFLQISRFFQRTGKGPYGSIFACLPDGHNTVFDFCLQLWTRGGKLINNKGEINIHSSEASDGLEFYREITNDKTAIHPQSKDFESVQAGLAFARGEAAMMINWFGFAALGEVFEESKVKGKVDVTNIPWGENGKSASLNVYWLYTIGSGSQNKALAYDFIKYAISRKNDKLLTQEGGIGCRISTWKDEDINRLIPYYHKLEMLHENAESLPLRSNWVQIAAVIDEVVLKTMNTDREIEALLREGQEKISLIENGK